MKDYLNSWLTTPLVFAIFFVALWCAICYLVSLMSGWLALSRRFRAQSEPYGDVRTAGPLFYSVYARFWSHYGGVIRMTAAPDALYLSMLFLFRPGHAPLCIPWEQIEISRTRRFLRDYVLMTLGSEERIPFRISERMARNLGILDRVAA